MGTKKNSVFKNYIYNTSYQILVLIAPLITTPYVSRVLGATGIGIYHYTQSIATYFIYAAAIGTTIYGQREIAYAQNDPEKRSKIFLEITSLRVTMVLLCTLIYFTVFGLGTEYSTVYKILTLEVLASALDISWFFMGMENFKITVIRNTIIKLASIASILIFVKSSNDVVIYTICLTVPIFIGNLSLWISLPKYLMRVSIQKKDILRHIKPSLILFVPQMAIEVYAVLDKTMLGYLATDISEVGYYTQATKIVKLTMTIVTSLGTVMLPAMSIAFAQGKKDVIVNRIQKAMRFVFLAGFPLTFGIAAVAKNFVPVFFGKGYDKVVFLMIVMSPLLLVIAIGNVFGKQYLLPTKQEKHYTESVITGAVVNVILNWILIGPFGALGASIATIRAESAVTIIQGYYVHKQINVFKCFSPAFKYLICGVIMFASVYLIGELLGGGVVILLIQIVFGAAVYGIELLITKDILLFEVIHKFIKR